MLFHMNLAGVFHEISNIYLLFLELSNKSRLLKIMVDALWIKSHIFIGNTVKYNVLINVFLSELVII